MAVDAACRLVFAAEGDQLSRRRIGGGGCCGGRNGCRIGGIDLGHSKEATGVAAARQGPARALAPPFPCNPLDVLSTTPLGGRPSLTAFFGQRATFFVCLRPTEACVVPVRTDRRRGGVPNGPPVPSWRRAVLSMNPCCQRATGLALDDGLGVVATVVAA